jgi:hypothetical protein
MVGLVCLVISFIWLNQTDQIDQMNQINQINPRLSRLAILRECFPVVPLCRCALAEASLESAHTYA